MVGEFDSFYERHYGAVLRAVVLLVPTVEDAHDVCQEAFLRAFRDWSRVASLENSTAWVRHVAVNIALDAGRRRRSLGRLLPRLAHEARSVPAPDPAALDLRGALSHLSLRQQRVLVLHHLCDLTVTDIAELLDCPEGTVKTHLTRGRAALAARLRLEEATSDA